MTRVCDLCGPILLAISWAGMYRRCYPVPNKILSSSISNVCTIKIVSTTTSVSAVWTKTHFWPACIASATCKKILPSASSWLCGTTALVSWLCRQTMSFPIVDITCLSVWSASICFARNLNRSLLRRSASSLVWQSYLLRKPVPSDILTPDFKLLETYSAQTMSTCWHSESVSAHRAKIPWHHNQQMYVWVLLRRL